MSPLEPVEQYLTKVAEEAEERPGRLLVVGIAVIGGWLLGAYTALAWLASMLTRTVIGY